MNKFIKIKGELIPYEKIDSIRFNPNEIIKKNVSTTKKNEYKVGIRKCNSVNPTYHSYEVSDDCDKDWLAVQMEKSFINFANNDNVVFDVESMIRFILNYGESDV